MSDGFGKNGTAIPVISFITSFREISKEDFDMDISNMQQELDNLKVKATVH